MSAPAYTQGRDAESSVGGGRGDDEDEPVEEEPEAEDEAEDEAEEEAEEEEGLEDEDDQEVDMAAPDLEEGDREHRARDYSMDVDDDED